MPDDGAPVEAVNYPARLPTFYEEDPVLWFIQVEAIFATTRVTTEEKRYQAVISQLPFKILTQVIDLARQQPEQEPYTTLKRRLLTVFSESKERKILRLLEDTQLGDMKPSQLLRHMQGLAEADVPNEVIKTIWLRALPPQARSILAAVVDEDLNNLAKIADRISETVFASSVPIATADSPAVNTIDTLVEEIRSLKTELRRRKPRPPKHRPARSTSRKRPPLPPVTLCYFHKRFGKNARKCEKPCSFKNIETPQLN